MTARKPVDPRLENVPQTSHRPPGTPGEEPDRRPPEHGRDEHAQEHANVEMESGPVDREERDDPFPAAS